MDMAAVALAGCAFVLILALVVQFFLWLKVRADHAVAVATWKGVIDAATETAKRASEEAAAATKAVREGYGAQAEARGEIEARFAEHEGKIATATAKAAANEESLAALVAKSAARWREADAREAKAAKQAKRAAKAAGDSEEGDPAAGGEDGGQGDLLRALAEQSAYEAGAGQAGRNGKAFPAAPGQGGTGGPFRLVPKR